MKYVERPKESWLTLLRLSNEVVSVSMFSKASRRSGHLEACNKSFRRSGESATEEMPSPYLFHAKLRYSLLCDGLG